MKKGLLFVLIISISFPAIGQFKTIKSTGENNQPRFETIGDVTNIKEDSPASIILPESAGFNFESIERSSIELNNLNTVKVVWSENRTIPLAIHGIEGQGPDQDLSIEDKTYSYLESINDLLGVEDIRNRFFIKKVTEDDLGLVHVKLKQHYKGIPNYGGEIIVHLREGKPYFLNGYWYPETPQSTGQITLRNKLDLKAIVKNDLKKFTDYRSLSRFEYDLLGGDQWQMEKVYYKPGDDDPLTLTWKITVHPNLSEEWTYFIDNKNGRIQNKFQSICKLHHHDFSDNDLVSPMGAEKAWAIDLLGVNRELNVYNHQGTYYMMDASRNMYNSGQSSLPDEPVGVIWTLDAQNTSPETNDFLVEHISSSNNNWNNKTAVSAHYNAQKAYEYYKNTFDRNSINGQGGNIISLINVVDADGNHMDNAFWSGKAMFYGNGKDAFKPLAGALDVAGHEMTHGVIQSTANLEYYGEPGAINESYADIFGCMIDRDDWQLGEDVVFTHVFTSGALRDMSNPHNGGSQLGDIGYQPSHVNEQYLGQEDNAGVHINSGIANYAFYKFATAIGREKAEQIYYRALDSYLTKSSKFVDLRVAIEQAAYDMYGANEKQAASNAFDAVGIAGGSSGGNNYQNDLEVNPGNDFVLYYDEIGGNLVLGSGDGSVIQDPFSTTSISSKPSISDNGSEIVFVGQDQMIHYIYIDWSSGQYEESIIQNEPIWRNVIVSKDGWRIAALTETLDNKIHIFDFGLNQWNDFDIYNPSTAEGVTAGDVDYIDVMEFNYSGEWIMYDAHNTINSEFGNDIEYWDIGFVQVFNNSSANFSDGLVQKLFSGLPENTSIGNATFSKNSPYIVAFDYLVGDNEYYILGSNLETGEVNQLYESISLGYPNYSRLDDQLLFDFSSFFGTDLAVLSVGSTKIDYVPNSDRILYANASWGVWFGNGVRDLVLSDNIELTAIKNNLDTYPNPVYDKLTISGEELEGEYNYVIVDPLGKEYMRDKVIIQNGMANLDLSKTFLPNGPYFISLRNGKRQFTKKIQILQH